MILFVWIWHVNKEVDQITEKIEIYQIIITPAYFSQYHILGIHYILLDVTGLILSSNPAEL